MKESLSARRAWIEIGGTRMAACAWIPSLSARRAWIEIRNAETLSALVWSLSARRAWIEITPQMPLTRFFRVALRKESVDRNPIAAFLLMWWQVALRKESVDRNWDIGG